MMFPAKAAPLLSPKKQKAFHTAFTAPLPSVGTK
jgi:hypothetical protein